MKHSWRRHCAARPPTRTVQWRPRAGERRRLCRRLRRRPADSRGRTAHARVLLRRSRHRWCGRDPPQATYVRPAPEARSTQAQATGGRLSGRPRGPAGPLPHSTHQLLRPAQVRSARPRQPAASSLPLKRGYADGLWRAVAADSARSRRGRRGWSWQLAHRSEARLSAARPVNSLPRARQGEGPHVNVRPRIKHDSATAICLLHPAPVALRAEGPCDPRHGASLA